MNHSTTTPPRMALTCVLTALCLGQQCIDPPESVITDLDSGWENLYLGSETDIPFFPDGNAVYLDYRFVTEPGAPVGIRLEGVFPVARYMGITIYDNADFTIHNRLQDTEIAPDEGSLNPFVEGVASSGAETYTVNIVPEAFVSGDRINEVSYASGLADVSVFVRYYLPIDGMSGDVPFPTLSAYDPRTGAPVPLPEYEPRVLEENPLSDIVRTTFRDFFVREQINRLFRIGDRRVLRAYRFDADGLFSNGDTSYLGMLVRKERDEVALIRFRPAEYATEPKVNATAQVRYWSISQGDDESYNLVTMADHEFRVHDDGHVYLAVCEPGPDIGPSIESENFMPWLVGERGILIFRHLVTHPDFEQGFQNVPAFNVDDPAEEQAAEGFIGDYAPTGMLINRILFVRDGFDAIRAGADGS